MTKRQQQLQRRNARANRVATSTAHAEGNAPTSVGHFITAKPSSVTIRNSEIWTTMNFTGAAEGYILIPVSCYGPAWLDVLSQSYSKFKFKKFAVSFVPSCSTTTSGVVAIGCGFDMADNVAVNTAGYQRTPATAAGGFTNSVQLWKPSSISPVWGASRVEFPQARFTENRIATAVDWDSLATTTAAGRDRNWFADGYIVVATDGPVSTALGRVMVEYEVELFNPYQALGQ